MMENEIEKAVDFLREHPGAILLGSPAVARAAVSVGLAVTSSDLVPEGMLVLFDPGTVSPLLAVPEMPESAMEPLWKRNWTYPIGPVRAE